MTRGGGASGASGASDKVDGTDTVPPGVKPEGLDPPSAWRRAEDAPAWVVSSPRSACVQSFADVGGVPKVLSNAKFEQHPILMGSPNV